MKKKFLLSACMVLGFSYVSADPGFQLIVNDSQNRVSTVMTTNTFQHFKYDALGNIKSETNDKGKVKYEYSDSGELIKAKNPELGEIVFKYDDTGRLTIKGDIEISYNDYNMMSSFIRKNISQYYYDQLTGLRNKKIVLVHCRHNICVILLELGKGFSLISMIIL